MVLLHKYRQEGVSTLQIYSLVCIFSSGDVSVWFLVFALCFMVMVILFFFFGLFCIRIVERCENFCIFAA